MGLFKKKPTVEPTDFLGLRAEVVELRARLDAAEQEKSTLEDRLASLDASTTALAAGHPDLSNLHQLQAELTDVQRRVAAAEARIPDAPDTSHIDARIDELSGHLDGVQQRLAVLNEKAAIPPPPPAPPPPPPAPSGPDPDTMARLDEVDRRLADADGLGTRIDDITQRIAGVDTLAAQLGQLSARVAGQAEMGAQLSGLRDRLGQMQDQLGNTDAMRDQVQQLAQRTRSADEFGALLQQLSERLERTEQSMADQAIAHGAALAAAAAVEPPPDVEAEVARQTETLRQHLEDRLGSMGTELANQISELGRDLDSLAAHRTDPEPIGASTIDVDAVIDELRASQVKLANEQARYEIAFRQDLAALAEALRRPSR